MAKVALYMFIASLVGYSKSFDYPEKPINDEYDYIVVGAGSAGAVVASTLSERKENSVLLLEAGGVPPAVCEVPMFTQQTFKTEIEWQGKMEAQNNSCDMNAEGRCWWSRSKTLGGCSSHNFMIYHRGNRKDYDYWGKIGAEGWSFKNVLKIFKDVEDYTGIGKNYYGRGGLLTVSPLAYKTQLGKAYMEGGIEIGANISDDYNEPSKPSKYGFSYTPVTQRKGLRCSTEKAFLQPAAFRPNQNIVTRAYVLKINFDDDKKAVSVVFDHKNKTKTVKVRKEVILSAGAVSSPAILMLSGIGPKEHLNDMKIPVVMNLPGVGQNLQDHPWVSLNYKINDSVGIVYNRDVNPENIGLLAQGKGPLTSPAFVEVTGHLNTKFQDKNLKWPDIMFHSGMASIYPLANANFDNLNSTGFIMTILRPKSRGFIKLRSPNPYEYPVVDPQYFSNMEDLDRLVEGTKFIMRLMKTKSLQRYNPQATPRILPGCEDSDPDSDNYVRCMVRRYLGGGYHLAGTCKMGSPNDTRAVVDSKLRVFGVRGLRVADASIMPVITSGNTNAPCIMIGRKASQMILTEA